MTAADAFAQLETTDVFDVPDSAVRQAVAASELAANPYRDPEQLRAAWREHGTVRGVADALDCAPETASKWLEAYGIRERSDAYDLARYLRRDDVGPEDVGLPADPGGESA